MRGHEEADRPRLLLAEMREQPARAGQEGDGLDHARGELEVEEDGGNPILKGAFDKQREMFGGLLNPTKVMAHCPPILRAAGMLGQSIEESGLLPKGLPALLYVRVATINGCPF